MKKILIIGIIFSLCAACEKSQIDSRYENTFIARIAGFDSNCSTCILQFPDDSIQVKRVIGKSSGDLYQTVNLNKGEYTIGQLIRVKIRKPRIIEKSPCIALYPTNNFESIYITESENVESQVLNDTVRIPVKDCRFFPEGQFFLCLDSVISDSRCPTGVICFWAGNARVRFHYEKINEPPVYFNLDTYFSATKEFTVDKFTIRLLTLLPYPSINTKPGPSGSIRATALVLVRKI